ncbi:MAG: hypothetical protein ACXWXZ_04015 [Candidatus Binatia bacterium]
MRLTSTSTGSGNLTASQTEQIERSRTDQDYNVESFIDAFCDSATAATIKAEIDAGNTYPTLHGLIVRNRISRAVAQGNNVGIHRMGCDELQLVGTPTARTIASTSKVTRARRHGQVSDGTTTGVAGYYHDNAGDFIGDGTVGGFTAYIKFLITDASAVGTARTMIGASSLVVITDINPTTATNCVMVGRGSGTTNLTIYFGGSAAQTTISLGANFPSTNMSADIYEFGLFAFPGLANKIGYFVRRSLTGQTTDGLLSATTPGTELPLSTTPLSLCNMWRSANGTASAVGLDFLEGWWGHAD